MVPKIATNWRIFFSTTGILIFSTQLRGRDKQNSLSLAEMTIQRIYNMSCSWAPEPFFGTIAVLYSVRKAMIFVSALFSIIFITVFA